MKHITVYQGIVVDWKRSKESHHGQCRAAVAAKSQRAAHAIIDEIYPMSFNYFRNYWTITGNERQIEAATKYLGKIVVASSLRSDDYEPQTSQT